MAAVRTNPEDFRVLVGCETSGAVREAFLALGFDAFSCDTLPSDTPTNRHFQCDIRDVLDDEWDLLAVFHPPCTRLCNSGVRWLNSPPKNLNPAHYSERERAEFQAMNIFQRHRFMWRSLDDGAELFSALWNADIPNICVENPIMHKHAKARIENYEPASQTVQPWWFGDEAFKGTGLYLRGLPGLVPTDKLTPPAKDTPEHKLWSAIHRAPPGPDRWKIRSKTFPGIASAMAEQWGNHLLRGEVVRLAA